VRQTQSGRCRFGVKHVSLTMPVSLPVCPQEADIFSVRRHVSKVPEPDILVGAMPSVQLSRVTLLATAKASRMLGSIPITYQLRREGHPWFSRAQFLVVDLSKRQQRVHWRSREWFWVVTPGLNRQSRTSSSSWRMTSATPMWAARSAGLYDAEHRSAGNRGIEIHAGVLQFA
jgi:hypothetical protein